MTHTGDDFYGIFAFYNMSFLSAAIYIYIGSFSDISRSYKFMINWIWSRYLFIILHPLSSTLTWEKDSKSYFQNYPNETQTKRRSEHWASWNKSFEDFIKGLCKCKWHCKIKRHVSPAPPLKWCPPLIWTSEGESLTLISPACLPTINWPGGGGKIDPSNKISNENHEKLRKCLESLLTNRL